MIAIDTNVVVRFLVGDDAGQARIAQQRIAGGAFISHGVLMEAEWVMRTAYRLPAARIADAFGDLLEINSVELDDPDDLRWAVSRYRLGADWADLLHLIAARAQPGFATFDRALPKQAGRDAPVAIEILD